MPYITAVEMKWRMKEALRPLQKLHSDMCNAPCEEVSKEITREFTDILCELITFSGKINEMADKETQTTVTPINPITCRCDGCGESMNVRDAYCSACGRKVVPKKKEEEE